MYFGEHANDIISLAKVGSADNDSLLLASGEIGKNPAIYLYKWVSGQGDGPGVFQSLCSMKGFHAKGVSQLCFSANGKQLFSVGVEYSVAVYCTDTTNKQFGKM